MCISNDVSQRTDGGVTPIIPDEIVQECQRSNRDTDDPVVWYGADGETPSYQSRDFIDGFGQGVAHGRRMERESQAYERGFNAGLQAASKNPALAA